MVHVDDFGSLVVAAASRPNLAPFLFAAGGSVTVAGLSAHLGRALELPVEDVSLPDAAAELGFFAHALAMDQVFDGAEARQAAGWSPQLSDPPHLLAACRELAAERRADAGPHA